MQGFLIHNGLLVIVVFDVEFMRWQCWEKASNCLVKRSLEYIVMPLFDRLPKEQSQMTGRMPSLIRPFASPIFVYFKALQSFVPSQAMRAFYPLLKLPAICRAHAR